MLIDLTDRLVSKATRLSPAAPPPRLVHPYSYLSVRTKPFLLELISACRSYEFQNRLQLDEQKGTIITICQTTMLAFQSPIHTGFVFPPKHIPRQPCAVLSPNLISYLSVSQMLYPCWKLEPIWQSSAVQPIHSAGLVKTDMLSFKLTFVLCPYPGMCNQKAFCLYNHTEFFI